MLFNLNFANNTILFWIFFVFLIIDLYILIAGAITQIFHTNAELLTPLGLRRKETKSEILLHPVIVEIAKI